MCCWQRTSALPPWALSQQARELRMEPACREKAFVNDMEPHILCPSRGQCLRLKIHAYYMYCIIYDHLKSSALSTFTPKVYQLLVTQQMLSFLVFHCLLGFPVSHLPQFHLRHHSLCSPSLIRRLQLRRGSNFPQSLWPVCFKI